VAARITNGEKYRLVGGARELKGLFTPGKPVDGVIGMLKKIGARFIREPVWGFAIVFGHNDQYITRKAARTGGL
jgi:hypothetical protein